MSATPRRRAGDRRVPEGYEAVTARQALRAFNRVVDVAGVRWKLAVLSLLSLVAGLAEAALLFLVANAAFAIAEGSDVVSIDWGPLDDAQLSIAQALWMAIAMGATMLGLGLFLTRMPARLGTDIFVRLRARLMRAWLRSDWKVMSEYAAGDLHENVVATAGRVSTAVMVLSSGLVAAINVVTLITASLLVSFVGTSVLIVASVGLFFAFRPVSKLTRAAAAQQRTANAAYTDQLFEVIGMRAETQVFGVADEVASRLDRATDAVAGPYYRSAFYGRLVRMMYRNVAIVCVVLGVVAVYNVGSVDVAALGTVILLLIRSLSYSQNLQTNIQSLDEVYPYLVVASDALDELEGAAVDPDAGAALDAIDRIELASVGFSYVPGQPVLHDVSLAIGRGEAVGIVGPSGGGKSTLFQLLLRLRQPDAGHYLINGVDAEGVRLRDWHRHVALVPQAASVFQGTVADNVRFFRDGIADDAVLDALRRAHLLDEVLALPDGIGARVGGPTARLSGGQLQRLCIARALVTSPDVLFLDEPTSALDVHSEAAFQESLLEQKGTTTLFIIAHRLSTLSVCDRILVLRNGVVEAFGTATEVRAASPYFRRALELSSLD